ncbi:MAG: hypothetical protein KDC38_18755, partial [Planctomycetes bacterium]|nr:hypothetical protein [Planctomycetota bacterium]
FFAELFFLLTVFGLLPAFDWVFMELFAGDFRTEARVVRTADEPLLRLARAEVARALLLLPEMPPHIQLRMLVGLTLLLLQKPVKDLPCCFACFHFWMSRCF